MDTGSVPNQQPVYHRSAEHEKLLQNLNNVGRSKGGHIYGMIKDIALQFTSQKAGSSVSDSIKSIKEFSEQIATNPEAEAKFKEALAKDPELRKAVDKMDKRIAKTVATVQQKLQTQQEVKLKGTKAELYNLGNQPEGSEVSIYRDGVKDESARPDAQFSNLSKLSKEVKQELGLSQEETSLSSSRETTSGSSASFGYRAVIEKRDSVDDEIDNMYEDALSRSEEETSTANTSTPEQAISTTDTPRRLQRSESNQSIDEMKHSFKLFREQSKGLTSLFNREMTKSQKEPSIEEKPLSDWEQLVIEDPSIQEKPPIEQQEILLQRKMEKLTGEITKFSADKKQTGAACAEWGAYLEKPTSSFSGGRDLWRNAPRTTLTVNGEKQNPSTIEETRSQVLEKFRDASGATFDLPPEELLTEGKDASHLGDWAKKMDATSTDETAKRYVRSCSQDIYSVFTLTKFLDFTAHGEKNRDIYVKFDIADIKFTRDLRSTDSTFTGSTYTINLKMEIHSRSDSMQQGKLESKPLGTIDFSTVVEYDKDMKPTKISYEPKELVINQDNLKAEATKLASK